MTVVTQQTVYSTQPTAWITGAADTTSPWFWVHGHLTNWVNGIGDPTKINILQAPNQATAYTSTLLTQWLLETQEAGANTGIQFLARYAGNTNTSYTQCYQARTAGAGNNGYGTYTTYGGAIQRVNLDGPTRFFVSYEADVALPWFWFGQVVRTTNGTAAETFTGQMISRLDRTNTGAVPNTAPWVSMSYSGTTLAHAVPTSQATTTLPWTGISSAGIEGVENGFSLWTDTSSVARSFVGPGWIVGNNYYLGVPNQTCCRIPLDSTPALPIADGLFTIVDSGNTYAGISPVHMVRVS